MGVLRLAIFITFLSSLIVVAEAKPFPQNKDGSSKYSVQKYYDKIEVEDDELEVTATISTRSSYKEKRKFGRAFVQKHIRAHKNKTTGIVSYQMYIYIENPKQFVKPVTVNYGKPLKAHKASRISFDVDCYSSRCTYFEHVTFPISDEFIRYLKAKNPGDDMGFYGGAAKFRLKTKAGVNVDLHMAEAEILAAAYKAEKH